MANLSSPAMKRSSFVGGAISRGRSSSSAATTATTTATATFGASKFFMKKQNRAATKIQALCRAFLVQARLFRERVLEPRLHELRDCQSRQAQELRWIQEQKQLEWETIPATIRAEFEASTALVESLKEDIAAMEADNERLRRDRKELKRTNRELEAEATQHKDADFRLNVQKNRLTKENKALEETLAEYKYAVDVDGRQQMDDWDKAVMKVLYQQAVTKKYVRKIIKLVEAKADDADDDSSIDSPPASPTPQTSSRRKSFALGERKSSVRGNKKKLSSKNKEEEPAFDWSKTLTVLEDDDADKNKNAHKDHNSSHGSLKNSSNHHLHGSHSSLKSSNGNNSNSGAGAGACFDWATQSYNWANQSIQLLDPHHDNPLHHHRNDDKIDPTIKTRRSRRHTTHVASSSGSNGKQQQRNHHHHGTDGGHGIKNNNNALRELVHELKNIKKAQLKQ